MAGGGGENRGRAVRSPRRPGRHPHGRAGDAWPGHAGGHRRPPARRLRHSLPGGARDAGGRRAADFARTGGWHRGVDGRPGAGDAHRRAAGAAAAGGAGLVPKCRQRNRSDHPGRRRAVGAGAAAGRGGGAGGDCDAGQPVHGHCGGVHSEILRRAAPRRPGGSGDGGGAGHGAGTAGLVDAGVVYELEERAAVGAVQRRRQSRDPTQSVRAGDDLHPGRAVSDGRGARRGPGHSQLRNAGA